MISPNDFFPTSRLSRVTAINVYQSMPYESWMRRTDLYQYSQQREDKELREEQESAVSTRDDSVDLRMSSSSLITRNPSVECP